jgi:hypothetical protein
MSIARRLAIGVLWLVVRLIQLAAVALATLIYMPAAIAMLLIALVILASIAVGDTTGTSKRRRGCAGASWSAKPAAA